MSLIFVLVLGGGLQCGGLKHSQQKSKHFIKKHLYIGGEAPI